MRWDGLGVSILDSRDYEAFGGRAYMGSLEVASTASIGTMLMNGLPIKTSTTKMFRPKMIVMPTAVSGLANQVFVR